MTRTTPRLYCHAGAAALALTAAAAVFIPISSSGKTAPLVQGASAEGSTITWDASTLVCVQTGATYGRMIRLPKGGGILCSYEKAGSSWVCRSRDEGKTWSTPVLVKELPDASAANPELLLLQSGRLLLFYNQRPRNRPRQDKKQPFAIGYCTSDDNGQTWRTGEILYEAGTTPEVGCWEPAAVQMPSGEIQLFFANEAPYPANADQEITLLRSQNNGKTWSRPETFSYRAGHRDGMPIPLQLKNKSLVVAIEDNGLIPGAKLQPVLLSASVSTNGKAAAVIGGSDSRRWGAIVPALPREVYAGAPYLRQFRGGGETVLSCQSDENKAGGTIRTKARMVVYVGDSRARNFKNPTEPFRAAGAGSDTEGFWNSLFVKNDNTITAISDTTVNGKRGLWAIDGRLTRSSNTARP